MFRQTEASGRSEEDQCNWKLDNSTAITSYGSGCRTASRIGVPTLPALVARRPAARRMAASICTVVVLPLVPVIVSQGAAPSRARIRQASSTSPQTRIPAAAADQQGLVRASRARSPRGRLRPPGRAAAARPGAHFDVQDLEDLGAPAAAGRAPAPRRRREPPAPRSASASAAAKPLMPRPATSTRRPDQAASRWVRVRDVTTGRHAPPTTHSA